MLKGYIEQDYRLNDIESLVLLRVENSVTSIVTHYVAVAIHPQNKPVVFRHIERADPGVTNTLFAMRTMFNGNHANTIIHKDNATTFNESIHLEN